MEPVNKHYPPGHYILSTNPEFLDPLLEILATDSFAMKEAKRYWNSSFIETDPNYMDGKQRYQLLRNYGPEIEILAKEWEEKARQRPGFFRDNYDRIKKLEKFGKAMLKDLSSPPKKDFVAKFVEDHPHQTMAINAVCIVSLTVFFAMRCPVMIPLTYLFTATVIYRTYKQLDL